MIRSDFLYPKRINSNTKGELGSEMDNYIFSKMELNDINKIVEIYNSNVVFLMAHMGISNISKEFILNEINEMKNVGFTSSIIKDNKGEIIGVCDFKIEKEAYLSLLMIHSKFKGKGLGKDIYNHLERVLKSNSVKRVRIDVVYDYEENVLGFWEKQGFVSKEKVELEWSGYKSNAIKMHKSI